MAWAKLNAQQLKMYKNRLCYYESGNSRFYFFVEGLF